MLSALANFMKVNGMRRIQVYQVALEPRTQLENTPVLAVAYCESHQTSNNIIKYTYSICVTNLCGRAQQ